MLAKIKYILGQIVQLPARIGENQKFVLFMAHAGVAFGVLEYFKVTPLSVAIAITITALKEFWYDMSFETNPPQTFQDSLEDWSEYILGIFTAVILTHGPW